MTARTKAEALSSECLDRIRDRVDHGHLLPVLLMEKTMARYIACLMLDTIMTGKKAAAPEKVPADTGYRPYEFRRVGLNEWLTLLT
jgi:hypothetical protein